MLIVEKYELRGKIEMPVENKLACLGNITILCRWMDRMGRNAHR